MQVPDVILTTARLVLCSFPSFLAYVESGNNTRLTFQSVKLFIGCSDTACMFLFKPIQEKLIFLF